MQDTVDRYPCAAWQLWLLSRWMEFRMNLISGVLYTAMAAAVVLQGDAGAAFAGFALTFCIQLTSSMTRAIVAYLHFELDMNAVELILEYTDIEAEHHQGRDPPYAWSMEGRIEIIGLTLIYAPHLPPVMSFLTLRVAGHQKVAVVGRTGVGQSSLALSLFRLLEAEEGSILIDGIDMGRVKLHHLRSRLAMILQDPVIFSRTLRSNLDLFGECGDGELVHSPEQVHWSGSRLSGLEDTHDGATQAFGLDRSALDEPVKGLGPNYS